MSPSFTHLQCRHFGLYLLLAAAVGYSVVGAVPATFDGRGYITYNIDNAVSSIKSLKDQVTLHYKTRQETAFLFYTGERPKFNGREQESTDHITVYLKHGSLYVHMAINRTVLATGPLKPLNVEFSDSRWHRLEIQRSVKNKITISFDGVQIHRETRAIAKNKFLQSQVLYLGGSEPGRIASIPGNTVYSMFKGCFKEIYDQRGHE